MIHDFETLCLYTYVLVDEILQAARPLLRRPGPAPVCSDSELITMVLVGELCGWDVETEMLSHWREHRSLFPHLPEQSRFNRRRRHLALVINLVRRALLETLDLAQDRQCVIDSLPIPVVEFHAATTASPTWKAEGAAFGRIVSKRRTIFGYRLHLLITFTGLILDFTLAPANVNDLEVGQQMLHEHQDLVVLGDKGYVSQPAAEDLLACNQVQLLAVPRSNQKQQWPAALTQIVTHFRQLIETVNSQLSEQLNIEKNRAHTLLGLCSRLYSKLTAHTLGFYLNRITGQVNCLHIKHLAFQLA